MAFVSRLPLWSAGLTASLLAACGSFSSSGPPAQSTTWLFKLQVLELVPDRSVDSIPAFRIDTFRVLDATHVLIHSDAQRSHVVTVGDACSALDSAQRLGYTTSGGALTRQDKLIAITPQAQMPCAIEAIQTLKKELASASRG